MGLDQWVWVTDHTMGELHEAQEALKEAYDSDTEDEFDDGITLEKVAYWRNRNDVNDFFSARSDEYDFDCAYVEISTEMLDELESEIGETLSSNNESFLEKTRKAFEEEKTVVYGSWA